MNKELELEAEKKYPVDNTGSMFMPNKDEINNSLKQEGFIAGATSKYVERQKLEFAIEQLKEFKDHYQERIGTGKVWNRIKELEQKLSEL